MSMWNIYLKTVTGDIYHFCHKLQDRISLDIAELQDEDEQDPIIFEDIPMEILKYIVKLYPIIHMSGVQMVAIVAHGDMLSFYSLKTFEWTGHH